MQSYKKQNEYKLAIISFFAAACTVIVCLQLLKITTSDVHVNVALLFARYVLASLHAFLLHWLLACLLASLYRYVHICLHV